MYFFSPHKSNSIFIYEYFFFFFFLGEQPTDADTETVCENGVCYKRPKQPNTESESTEDASSSTQDPSNEERLNRAKHLLEKKRKEKDEEDSRVSSELNCFKKIVH